jgi:predicted GNAT family acetyltransferase
VEYTVRDNQDRQRYELVIDNEIVSIADYRLDGDSVVVPHVETSPAHRGRGNADRLMAGMLDDLRDGGRTIVPLCPFAANYIHQHPDQQDLVTPR